LPSRSATSHAWLAEVAGEAQRFAALLLDGVHRHVRVVVFLEVGDGNLGALAREQHRGRPADAAVAAGHQRDLAFQPPGAGIARLPVGQRIELALVPRQLGLFVDFLDVRLVDGVLEGVAGVGHDGLLRKGNTREQPPERPRCSAACGQPSPSAAL
jgi:hypothetical protein